MTYKGYFAKMEVDEDEGVIYGRVIGLSRDGITFSGKTVEESIEDFHGAVTNRHIGLSRSVVLDDEHGRLDGSNRRQRCFHVDIGLEAFVLTEADQPAQHFDLKPLVA